MCPACLGAAAWAVAGTTSAGGVVAFIVKKFRRKDDEQRKAGKSGAQVRPSRSDS